MSRRVKPQFLRLGNSQSPVVVIDGFSGAVDRITQLADKLAPFPAIKGNYYPGLRRVIAEGEEAYGYVFQTCGRAAPLIGDTFGVQGLSLGEASFSLVTRRPEQLEPIQRRPHFDTEDQTIFAMLHYLRVPPGSGTAFYRHRATGIERVTDATVAEYLETAKAEAAMLPKDSGYMHGSNEFYEQIGVVEAVPDRLIIYHGSLLHSGVIPPEMSFSADPRAGRLTGNFFLKGHGAGPTTAR